MTDTTPNVDPKNKGRAIFDEADIGSGERSPGQHDTEALIREIPTLPPSAGKADEGDKQEKAEKAEGKRQESGA
ncbi:hypothetical protein AB2N08_16090 [Massilia aurea]|uniref:hypothetical protein n=1 Tax=Massilia aurea TaxID=373040 RepID=UPI003462B74B